MRLEFKEQTGGGRAAAGAPPGLLVLPMVGQLKPSADAELSSFQVSITGVGGGTEVELFKKPPAHPKCWSSDRN